jgi:hypothetical protein
MAGSRRKTAFLPLAFKTTKTGNDATQNHHLTAARMTAILPKMRPSHRERFYPPSGGASRAFGFPQAAAKRFFAGRSPHPLLTAEVTKKLDGGSGRFCLGFDGFAVDENGAG